MSTFEQFNDVAITLGITQNEITHVCYLKLVEGIIFIGNYNDIDYTISSYELASVIKIGDSSLSHTLRLKTKHFLCFTIRFTDCKDASRAQAIISNFLQISSYTEAVALYPPITTKYPSIERFDLEKEYNRMGLPNDHWRISSQLNLDYKLCSTYPDLLVVPSDTSDRLIMDSSTFRSRNRIPVLCFYHKSLKTSLCRSSQPLLGLNSRNDSDEKLLEIIGDCSDSPKRLIVIDNRPKINALANRAGGKGYELKQFYPNIEFIFKSIENIHVMRNSLNKLIDIIEQKGNCVEAISSSMWFNHLQAILDCSVFIVEQLIGGYNVLAHCSDGWDRTSQTCALASLLLDPYHRTIEGFWALIEREWLAFGHQFATRCGHFTSTVDQKFISPVFVQFMDCVWQIFLQFPCLFEFDERLLIFIVQQSFSCCFGDFLYNSQNERISACLYSKSVPSLYSYVKFNLDKFSNKLYDSDKNLDYQPFPKPNSDTRILQLWSQLYLRGGRARENDVRLTKNFEAALEDEVRLMAEKEQLEDDIRSLVKDKGLKRCKELILGLSNEDVDAFDNINF